MTQLNNLGDHVDGTLIAESQSQKATTSNAVDNLLSDATQKILSKTITGNTTLTDDEFFGSFFIDLGGTPAADFSLFLPNSGSHTFTVRNGTGKVATVDSGTSGGTVVVIPDGGLRIIHADGTDTVELASTAKGELGYIPLDITSLREIGTDTANQTGDTADGTANDPYGGLLAADTTPSLLRINLATDKALRVAWPNTDVTEVQFPPITMPPDLDETVDVTVHLIARMSGGADTTTSFDVQVFDGIGDTEMGGLATPDMTSSLAELTLTISAANISGHPLGVLNISLVPEAHGTDNIELYGAWIEYTKKLPA